MEYRFGFIKYNSYFDAENCIRAFFYLGYEAKFARVQSSLWSTFVWLLTLLQQSHNARLKELADPKNNNLYVSNLPRLWNDKVSTSSLTRDRLEERFSDCAYRILRTCSRIFIRNITF